MARCHFVEDRAIVGKFLECRAREMRFVEALIGTTRIDGDAQVRLIDGGNRDVMVLVCATYDRPLAVLQDGAAAANLVFGSVVVCVAASDM